MTRASAYIAALLALTLPAVALAGGEIAVTAGEHGDHSRIVVYYGQDWVSPATRVLFTLQYAGLGDRSQLLDGGMAAWQRAGHALSKDEPPLTVGRLSTLRIQELLVDADRRDRLRANHSATHLLHEALRRRLGDHVAQKGSLVAPERLRFDFSQPTSIAREDLAWVESEVNRRVRQNSPVTTRLMTPDAAIGEGAMALFGEKYGDEVRVVSMGGDLEAGGKSAWSVELCGGTHVGRTGDIGLVKIVAEGAVAAGVRRVEAVTGIGALDWLNAREAALAEASAELKTTPEDLPARVHALIEERRRLERELVETRKKLASGGSGGGATKTVSGVTFAGRSLDGVPARELKGVADGLKQEIGSGVVAVVSNDDGKASLVVAVTDDLTGRFSAVDLVRAGSAALGGKGGGGRPDMAQAGGPDGTAGDKALAAIEAALASAPAAA